MSWLELRVLPPVVTVTMAALAYGLARVLPELALQLPAGLRLWIVVPLALAGLALEGSAVLHFRKARTTINPMRPANSSALVEAGIYRVTRNPMYLGMLLLLAAWTAWLANAVAFAVLPMFVAYITRFQIMPEERVLASRFGASFAAYSSRVRRWI